MVFNNDTLYPADILRRTIFDFFEINEITEYPLENLGLGLGDKIMPPREIAACLFALAFFRHVKSVIK
jgi:hypothetical protein